MGRPVVVLDGPMTQLLLPRLPPLRLSRLSSANSLDSGTSRVEPCSARSEKTTGFWANLYSSRTLAGMLQTSNPSGTTGFHGGDILGMNSAAAKPPLHIN